MTYKISLAFCFISFNLYSQNLSTESRYTLARDTLFVFNREEVIAFNPDNLSVLSTKKIKYHSNVFAEKFSGENSDFFDSRVITIDDQIYFHNQGGGEVYLYKNDSIKRVDSSFNHRMQVGGAIFVKGNRLYKYGGYGFWSARNVFTYYDTQSDQWRVDPPLHSKNFPNGSIASKISIQNNHAVIIGGTCVDQNDLTTRKQNKDLWNYNFDAGKWTYIGQSLFEIDNWNYLFHIDEKLYYINDSEIKEINPYKNTIRTYNRPILLNKLVYRNIFSNPIFYKGYLYYVTFIDNSNSVAINKISEQQLLERETEVASLYNPYNPWWKLIYLLVIPLAYSFFRIGRKLRKVPEKLKFDKNGVVYKGVVYDLSNVELRILKKLLENDYLYKSDVDDLVLELKYTLITTNKVMKELNYKLKLILKTDQEIIHIKKSLVDKRYTEYSIEQSYFNEQS